jgi:hypothetical protein
MASADPDFPASRIKITRVYLVDCIVCGAVNASLADCLTPAEAAELKRDHLRRHHEGEDEIPDPPRSVGKW